MSDDKKKKKLLKKNLTLLFEQTESIAKTGSWELNLKDQSLFWSDGVFEILGYAPQSFEVSFEKGVEVIHPEDRIEALTVMEQAINENSEYRIQKRFITKDGSIKHILSSGRVLKNKKGIPLKIVGVFQDVTDFVITNEKLSNLKSLIEVTASSVDGIIWEADANTFQFTFVSNQVEKVLGYTSNEWLSENNFWINHIHPEDRETAVNFCHKETLEGRDHTFNYRMQHKDGHYIWLQDRVTVIKENGKPTFLRGLLVNIDKEKIYLEKIEEEKNLSMNLIKYLPNVVFLFDQKGKILLWNDKFLELSGYTTEEAIGLTPFHFFDLERNDQLILHLKKIDKEGFTEVETEFKTKKGEKKPMLFIATKFKYQNQDCIYGVGVDVSQRNELISEQRKLLQTIETIIQFTPESLLVFNEQYDLIKKNKTFDTLVKKYAKLLNYKEEEFHNHLLQQLIDAVINKKSSTITIMRNSNRQS